MKKMQEFVLKGKNIFVGLEDSQSTWKVCVRSEGMIVDEASMPARYEVLKGYFDNRFPECRIKLMYEAGFHGFWLHDLLKKDGIDCIVTPPNKVTIEKDYRVKTDKRDARRLAKNLENKDYASCNVPSRERRENRQLSRTLDQINKDIKRKKNQIRRMFDFHHPVEGLKNGAWTDKDYFNLRNIELSEPLKMCLEGDLDSLELSLKIKEKLEKELIALSKKEQNKESTAIKKSVPGIGQLTAIRLTLELGDMNRFETPKHFASYLGLTASEYSTGETIKRGRITGQGPSNVRTWFIEMSWIAIRKDPALLEKFQNVWRNTGSKKKAIVAVARKLASRLWVLEKTGQNYLLGVIK